MVLLQKFTVIAILSVCTKVPWQKEREKDSETEMMLTLGKEGTREKLKKREIYGHKHQAFAFILYFLVTERHKTHFCSLSFLPSFSLYLSVP
jgi:hypothetical protein